MAGYSYIHRDYKTYDTPSPDDWRRTGCDSPDHVCRPVIIDAEGRKRPVITHTPTYVTKTETVVLQHDLAPFGSSEYNHGNHLTRDSWEDYGVEDPYRKPPSSVIGRPHTVDAFFNKIHTEASHPSRFVLSTDRRHAPKPTGYDSKNGIYDEFYGREFLKHGGKRSQNDYDDYHHKQGSTEPAAMNATGGWPRSSHARWSSPPPGSLTRPTNDINEAMAMLKETVKGSVTNHPYTTPYAEPVASETIHKKEAAKRYGNLNHNHSPRPYASEDFYSTNIDSREAARKYGGRVL